MNIIQEFPNYKLNRNTRSMDQICNITSFEQQKHQKFVGEYMFKKSKDNPRILLYHGLGSGKTCSSIVISQRLKNLTSHKTIVVVPAALQNNYKKELMSDCVSNAKYLKSSEKKEIKRLLQNKQICEIDDKKRTRYDKIIKSANDRINKDYEIMSYQGFVKKSNKKQLKLNNRLVIIDEVQNIISLKGSNYKTFHDELVLTRPKNMKLVLLSGTPIIDTVDEIALVLNLLDNGNNQLPTGKEFINNFIDDTNYDKTIIKNQHILYNAIKGKISFFSGISPNAYPRRVDKIIKCPMSKFQSFIYDKSLGDLTNANLKDFTDKNIKNPFTKSFFISPRQASNVVYNNGKVGLKHRPDNLKASQIISSKFTRAIENIKSSPGTTFVYSNFVSACGVMDFAILLENSGFKEVTPDVCPIGKASRFAIFKTGQEHENSRILTIFNSPKNKDGDFIKIIIGSPAMKEGVSLLRVRSVHLLDPYWNNSRTEQIIGRAIRFCSHKDMHKNERNVVVNHYFATHSKMGIDEYIHKIANYKQNSIDAFINLMIKFAFDCELFKHVNNVDNCGFSSNVKTLPDNILINFVLGLKNTKQEIIEKINKLNIKKDNVSHIDMLLYSKDIETKFQNFTKNVMYVLKTLFNNITISVKVINSNFKDLSNVCFLKFKYSRSKKTRQYSSIPKFSNLNKLLKIKQHKKFGKSRAHIISNNICPKHRTPINGECMNPIYPFKRIHSDEIDCCYKKNLQIKKLNNLPLSIGQFGLKIGTRKCMSYNKYELRNLARSLNVETTGTKIDLCNRIKQSI